MMFPTKVPNVSHAIEVLKPCRVTYTSNSIYVTANNRTYTFTSTDTKLKSTELLFIKKFRKYYSDNPRIKFDKRFVKVKPEFFKFFKESGIYDDIIEIDINRAYPSAGRILGIIPDDLFQEGLQFSKAAFLVAIGSLYRKKRVVQVFSDGRRELISDEERDPQLAKIWRSITGFTDFAMKSVIASRPNSVYFYWCDALFVKREDADYFQQELLKFGFETKRKEIEHLKYTDEKAIVKYVGKKELKEFTRPVRTYSVSDIETIRKRYERKK